MAKSTKTTKAAKNVSSKKSPKIITVPAQKMGFSLEATNAVYNKETKSYDTLGSVEIKARYNARKEIVVFTCRGCSLVASKAKSNDSVVLHEKVINLNKWDETTKEFLSEVNKSKAKALKSLLLKRFNLKDCKWSTLIAKCTPLDDKTASKIEAKAC